VAYPITTRPHIFRFLRWWPTAALLGFVIALTTGAVGPSAAATEPSLAPAPKHIRATRLITHLMERYHYRKTQLDDELSRALLQQFLENLDSNRSYFLADDIRQFERSQNNFDDYLKSAELKPAYAIFAVFRKRVQERVEFAESLVQKPFDFAIDEQYRYDRRDVEWAQSREQLDDVWRKRVKNDVLNLRLTGKDDADIVDTLRKRYQRLKRRTTQLNADDVFQFFVNAYVSTVEPHTAYFSPRTSENFKIRMSLSLEGIGAVLQTENDYTEVRSVVPGGPADKSEQLKSGDRIVGVGQDVDGAMVDVIGWRLDDVVDLIRGPKDTVLRLDILPKDAGPEGPIENITLTRNRIKLDEQAAQKSIHRVQSGGRTQTVGVIDLPAFYVDFEAKGRGDEDFRSTTRDVVRLLVELQDAGVDGIVMDLRGNGGGSLSESTSLTGLFIKSGPVVQVKDSSGRLQVNLDPDPAIVYEGPLAVLVDRQSASASEIFAGAIQDYGRGIIIGEPTFGKGTVQNLFSLDRFAGGDDTPLGQLKLTVAQFFRINGESTQHRGVVPDIVFPTVIDADDQGERALENALPWAAIQPAAFQQHRFHDGPDTFVKTRNRHETRIGNDPGFTYLIAEAKERAENAARKEVSLLEMQRQQQKERRESESLARENRLRTARGLQTVGSEDTTNEDDDTDDTEFPGDVLLDEATRVLADYIVASRPGGELQQTIAGDTGVLTTPSQADQTLEVETEIVR